MRSCGFHSTAGISRQREAWLNQFFLAPSRSIPGTHSFHFLEPTCHKSDISLVALFYEFHRNPAAAWDYYGRLKELVLASRLRFPRCAQSMYPAAVFSLFPTCMFHRAIYALRHVFVVRLKLSARWVDYKIMVPLLKRCSWTLPPLLRTVITWTYPNRSYRHVFRRSLFARYCKFRKRFSGFQWRRGTIRCTTELWAAKNA
jgi:hypothetical protein